MDAQLPPIEQIRAARNRVKALLKREGRKLLKQRDEVLEASQYGKYSQIADSLMASPAAAPRGTAKAAVINIHTEEIEEITLNPALDAVENAELLYRKARKGKRGHETAAGMMEETAARVGRLKDVLVGIDNIINEKRAEGSDGSGANSSDMGDRLNYDNATSRGGIRGGLDPANRIIGIQPPEYTGEDVERVRKIAEEFLPPEAAKTGGRKKAEETVPFKKYTINGWDVYLGKNSEQNDELSTRFAKPSDIWLHVAAHAGSHVIIRRKKDAPYPPKEIIYKAAQLAVWFSKAKHTSFAEVHVTEARFVRKRRHSPPGEVIAERCKAVRVEPKDPKLLF
jgi:predicted ribosome quality control (RQC) complex YloA/Tae2 family protein